MESNTFFPIYGSFTLNLRVHPSFLWTVPVWFYSYFVEFRLFFLSVLLLIEGIDVSNHEHYQLFHWFSNWSNQRLTFCGQSETELRMINLKTGLYGKDCPELFWLEASKYYFQPLHLVFLLSNFFRLIDQFSSDHEDGGRTGGWDYR